MIRVPGAKQQLQTHVFLGMTSIVASPVMQRLLAMVERVAASNATVLITGESGVGKEMIARALHFYSRRAQRPWVDVNCGALPDQLMESELFGHERGAFSGADSFKPGLFELAHQGTLFLDEIGELDPRMQVKLLRVLDRVPYFRLGGIRKVSVDVRIVAATNRNLERAVAEGRFRSDLFHRLTQFSLDVPSLRERTADIGPLARFFLADLDPSLRLTEAAVEKLEGYAWPGNIRELRNVVTQAALLAHGDEIGAANFKLGRPAQASGDRDWNHPRYGHGHGGAEFRGTNPAFSFPTGSAGAPDHRNADHRSPDHGNSDHRNPDQPNVDSHGDAPAPELAGASLEEMERRLILAALKSTGGHQMKAAEQLGISRRTLSRKLKLYQEEGANVL